MDTSTCRTDVRWIQNGVTVIGGNEWSNELNKFARPLNIDIDDETVYVSDHFNHRIILR